MFRLSSVFRRSPYGKGERRGWRKVKLKERNKNKSDGQGFSDRFERGRIKEVDVFYDWEWCAHFIRFTSRTDRPWEFGHSTMKRTRRPDARPLVNNSGLHVIIETNG